MTSLVHKLDKELYEKSSGLTTLISDYPTNRKNECTFYCNVFEYEFKSRFSYMKQRDNYLSPKLRLELEARLAIKEKYGDHISIPDDCRVHSRDNTVKIMCDRCNSEHKNTVFNVLQSKYGCKICGKKNKSETQKRNNGNEHKFLEHLKKHGWRLIGDYTALTIPCEIECPNKHIVSIEPRAFLRYDGVECPDCLIHRQNALADDRCKELNWKRTSDYVGRHKQMTFLCSNKHLVSMQFGDFVGDKNLGCKKCSGVCPEDAKSRFYENLKTLNIIAIDEYDGNKQQVKCYREACKHKVLITPIYLAQGSYKKCDECKNETLMHKFAEALANGEFRLHNKVEKASDHAEITCRLNHPRKAPVRDIAEGHQCLECSRMSHSLATLLSHDEMFLYRKTRGLYFVPFIHNGKVKYKRGVCSERGVKARHPTTHQEEDGIEIIDYMSVEYMSNFNALLTELFIGMYFRSSAIDMQGVLVKCKGGSECHNLNILEHYSLNQLELLARMHISEVVEFALKGT